MSDSAQLLAPQPLGIPIPEPGRLSMPYWQAAARGELVFQRCVPCGSVPMKPVSVCAECGSRDLAWQPSAGLGSLYSWTVVGRPQTPAFIVPYAPAIVRMDEGWWLMSSVIGCAPGDLADGLRLAVEFHPVSDVLRLPYVRPA